MVTTEPDTFAATAVMGVASSGSLTVMFAGDWLTVSVEESSWAMAQVVSPPAAPPMRAPTASMATRGSALLAFFVGEAVVVAVAVAVPPCSWPSDAAPVRGAVAV
ncbi:hypothetical protein ABID70_000539 [Clavibacter michiganensis]